MNRLRKKCYAFSAGVHALLIAAVVFGLAFATSKQPVRATRVITMSIDGAPPLGLKADPTTARRVETSQPAQPTPPTPEPQQPSPPQPPQPPTPSQPDPPTPRHVEKATPKTVEKTTPKGPDKVTPRAVDKSANKTAPKENSRPKPNISTKVVERPNPNVPNAKSGGPSHATKLASLINPNAVGSLRGQMSDGVNPISFTPGASSYSGYEGLVVQIYQEAWKAGGWPRQFYTEMVTVRVVILKDGSVKSAAVVKRSGRAPLDETVQRAINTVQAIGRPFPAGVKETQQTFTINFEMRN